MNLAARLPGSKAESVSLKSAGPGFRGLPVCCGEFSWDFRRLSTSLAMATNRSNPCSADQWQGEAMKKVVQAKLVFLKDESSLMQAKVFGNHVSVIKAARCR